MWRFLTGAVSRTNDTAEVAWQPGRPPATVVAKGGEPIRIVFRRLDATEATESVSFPDFGILATLAPYTTTPVDLGRRDAGRYPFCSPDGQIQGCLIVEA